MEKKRLDLLEDLDGELPNKIARPVDGFYIYAYDKDTLHKMEVRNGRVLWSEEFDLENEGARQTGEIVRPDYVESGKESNGENEPAKNPFGSRNQGSGCS